MKSFLVLLLTAFSINLYANSEKKNPFPLPKPTLLQQFGGLTVQFDLVRVVQPYIVNNTNPTTYRAYLPVCPANTTYVGGVNPNLYPLDQSPNYFYCKCICFNQCGPLPGISSTGGNSPLYTARVTCAVTVHGWFDKEILQKSGGRLQDHKYFYCQAGNCSTHPLPSYLNYVVPTGGFQNTTQINFLSCPAANDANQCGAPDQTAIGKPIIF